MSCIYRARGSLVLVFQATEGKSAAFPSGRVTRRLRGFWLVDRGFAEELRLVGAVSRRARRYFPRRRFPQKVFRFLVAVS